MNDDGINYGHIVGNALRGVLRDVLIIARDQGLPGQHHFYMTFRTTDEGVKIAPHLLARHPEEMTIVLQHQFWNLVVDDDGFAIDLSFSGRVERLHIPFAAVTRFVDPSVHFNLQFQQLDEDDEDFDDDDDDDDSDMLTGDNGSEPGVFGTDIRILRASTPEKTGSEESGADSSDKEESGAGSQKKAPSNVVVLDSFRRK